MPGESNTIGDYSAAEIAAMNASEFNEAKERGFKRPLIAAPGAVEELVGLGQYDRPAAAGLSVGSSVPTPGAQPSGANVWARNKTGDREFTCPSGQTCRLKPLSIEQLMMEGILDQVTRLEGLAQELIDRAQGLPPEKQSMPSREDFAKLLHLINIIVPLAVAQPVVYKDDDQAAPADAIRVGDIDIMDRVAILNEALSGLKKLDNFRLPG